MDFAWEITEVIMMCALASMAVAQRASGKEPVHIGSRLELMVDDYLIARMGGGARLELHRPIRREIATCCEDGTSSASG